LLVSSALALGFVLCLRTAQAAVHAQDGELGEIVPNLDRLIKPKGLIVARKPHIGFYAGSQVMTFPDVASLDELKDSMLMQAAQPVYLYYGSIERRLRPQFQQLLFPEASPAWLRAIAQSKIVGQWALYRIDLDS
jgi:hypothetical protein